MTRLRPLARALVTIFCLLLALSATASAGTPRIVGGSPTTHPWPAQAQLSIAFPDGSALCGGTLVAPKWVLTAAHCVTNDDGSVIGAGSFTATLGSSKLSGEGGTEHSVAQVVRHPSYNPATYANDAALLRLTTASSQTPLEIISNDALTFADPAMGGSARVIGWGTTSSGGDVSEDLLQVDVPLVDDATCATNYGADLIGALMLCAGQTGLDSCQGDSGGPLMVNTGTGITTGADVSQEGWKLAGIVSWGVGCADEGYPGVYTELANTSIRSWIYTNITGLALGLQNSSFESPLDGATDWQTAVYDANGGILRSGAGSCPDTTDPAEMPRRICRVGADTFEVTDGDGTRELTVNPLDGDSMLRLGGPFHSSGESQNLDRYVAKQTFVVDPANPVLELNYNMLTYDYTNFDELRLRVRLYDEDGTVVYNKVVGSFGPGGDTSFKSTGWRGAKMDLSPYSGEPVTVRLDAGGTSDTLYAFWIYVDAGTVSQTVGELPAASVPTETPSGGPVLFSEQVDANGLTNFNIANSTINQFQDENGNPICMYMKVPVPINSGTSTVSDVSLLLDAQSGPQTVALDDPDADKVWTVVDGNPGLCIQSGANGVLYVVYTLTENGVTQDFVTPIGGITLIDPQGIVYDKSVFDAAKAAGKTDEEARAQAAIGGAVVTLQRKVGEAFQTVLSGDPGISPNINPETTPSEGATKGLYQWDVSAGDYRVVVVKPGYETATSDAVSIPPPVLDLHIPMVRKKATASFTSAPAPVEVNKQVTLTSTSTHPDGPSAIASTKWDLDNDGAFDDATGASAQTTFASAGDKTVRVEVTDDDGDVSVSSGTVTVKAAPAVNPPVVNPPAVNPPVVNPPVVGPVAKPKPCANLKGTKLVKCKNAQKRKAALKKCAKIKGKKNAKKKAACVKKAKAIGKKKKG